MEQDKAEEEKKDILIQADRRNKFITVVASIALSVMGAMFVGLTLFAGVNLSSEIDRLANFRKDLKADVNEFIGKSDRRPNIELFSGVDMPLEGFTLPAGRRVKVEDKMKVLHIYFSLNLKNKGSSTAKIELIKFYFKYPLIHKSISTDEKEYDCEDYMDPDTLKFSLLPAGASRGITYWFDMQNIEIPQQAHPVLAKVYYGEKQPAVCKFNIKFPENK